MAVRREVCCVEAPVRAAVVRGREVEARSCRRREIWCIKASFSGLGGGGGGAEGLGAGVRGGGTSSRSEGVGGCGG